MEVRALVLDVSKAFDEVCHHGFIVIFSATE